MTSELQFLEKQNSSKTSVIAPLLYTGIAIEPQLNAGKNM